MNNNLKLMNHFDDEKQKLKEKQTIELSNLNQKIESIEQSGWFKKYQELCESKEYINENHRKERNELLKKQYKECTHPLLGVINLDSQYSHCRGKINTECLICHNAFNYDYQTLEKLYKNHKLIGIPTWSKYNLSIKTFKAPLMMLYMKERVRKLYKEFLQKNINIDEDKINQIFIERISSDSFYQEFKKEKRSKVKVKKL